MSIKTIVKNYDIDLTNILYRMSRDEEPTYRYYWSCDKTIFKVLTKTNDYNDTDKYCNEKLGHEKLCHEEVVNKLNEMYISRMSNNHFVHTNIYTCFEDRLYVLSFRGKRPDIFNNDTDILEYTIDNNNIINMISKTIERVSELFHLKEFANVVSFLKTLNELDKISCKYTIVMNESLVIELWHSCYPTSEKVAEICTIEIF